MLQYKEGDLIRAFHEHSCFLYPFPSVDEITTITTTTTTTTTKGSVTVRKNVYRHWSCVPICVPIAYNAIHVRGCSTCSNISREFVSGTETFGAFPIKELYGL